MRAGAGESPSDPHPQEKRSGCLKLLRNHGCTLKVEVFELPLQIQHTPGTFSRVVEGCISGRFVQLLLVEPREGLTRLDGSRDYGLRVSGLGVWGLGLLGLSG